MNEIELTKLTKRASECKLATVAFPTHFVREQQNKQVNSVS